ncbi:MAG: hypothetical protein ACWA5W_08810 [Phycisphaerales bacterium]
MNSIGPLIFLALAFGFTIAARVVILLVLRSGETSRTTHTTGPGPTVIPSDLFDTNEPAPNHTRTHHDHHAHD